MNKMYIMVIAMGITISCFGADDQSSLRNSAFKTKPPRMTNKRNDSVQRPKARRRKKTTQVLSGSIIMPPLERNSPPSPQTLLRNALLKEIRAQRKSPTSSDSSLSSGDKADLEKSDTPHLSGQESDDEKSDDHSSIGRPHHPSPQLSPRDDFDDFEVNWDNLALNPDTQAAPNLAFRPLSFPLPPL